MAASPSKVGLGAQGSGEPQVLIPSLSSTSRTGILPCFEMLENNFTLKDRVRAFWQENPCGTKFADAPPGSRKFYELVEEHRYAKEWHIPVAAGFSQSKNLNVLEVGCGLGTDGAQFAKAGAIYTGIKRKQEDEKKAA